jgi:hypothetical protein
MANLLQKATNIDSSSGRRVFRNAYVTLRNISYLCEDASIEGGSLSGGVLGTGQTVWTREVYEPYNRPRSTTAFVQGIGIVSLDPRWLVRADSLDE